MLFYFLFAIPTFYSIRRKYIHRWKLVFGEDTPYSTSFAALRKTSEDTTVQDSYLRLLAGRLRTYKFWLVAVVLFCCTVPVTGAIVARIIGI